MLCLICSDQDEGLSVIGRLDIVRLGPLLTLHLVLAGVTTRFGAPALAQVSATGAGGLNTAVNGVVGGSCSSGLCNVDGGTAAGANLLHRFSSFDTRGAITGVQINNGGFSNVVVGVTAPQGTFIDKPVSLSTPGSLFWLSPGGIAVSGSGGFVNTTQLTLSTATSQRIGEGRFDVFGTTPQQAALLFGTPRTGAADLVLDPALRAIAGMAPDPEIVLQGVSLTVDRSLLVDNPAGLVSVAGSTLSAASSTGTGGSITLTGHEVWVDGSSSLLATGPTGGGLIQVGGSWQNSDPSVRQALRTWIGSGALLDASATLNGPGGTVVAWSDITNPASATVVAGTLLATGGPQGGDGGRIETSGRWLAVDGIQVSTAAPFGRTGMWLLDPDELTISAATTANVSGQTGSYTAGTGVSNLQVTTLNSALPNTSVTVIAPGDIVVQSQIQYANTPGSTPGSLTLQAGGGIVLNAGINLTSIGGINPVSVTLQSGTAGGLSGSGGIQVQAGATTTSINITQGGNTVYNGVLAGTAKLNKLGTGSLTLAGASTYSGGTAVQAGYLRAQNSSAVGSGAVTVSAGATFELAGGISLANAFNISGAGVGTVGVLRNISGANTITGLVSLQFSDHTITSDAGTLTFDRPGTTANAVQVGAAYTTLELVLRGSGDLVFNDPINLSYQRQGVAAYGSLTKMGLGTLFLNAANTLGPTLGVNGGTLAYANAEFFGGNPQVFRTLILDGATLRSSVSHSFGSGGDGEIFLGMNGGTWQVDSGLTVTFGAAITGNGNFTKSGAGTLILNGANNYTGTTTVKGGTLTVNQTPPTTATCDGGSSNICPTATVATAQVEALLAPSLNVVPGFSVSTTTGTTTTSTTSTTTATTSTATTSTETTTATSSTAASESSSSTGATTTTSTPTNTDAQVPVTTVPTDGTSLISSSNVSVISSLESSFTTTDSSLTSNATTGGGSATGGTSSTSSTSATTSSTSSESTSSSTNPDATKSDTTKSDTAKSDATKSESAKSDEGKGSQQASANTPAAATGNNAGAPPTTTVPAQQAAVASQQADQQSGRQALSNLVPERSGSALSAPSVPQMQQSLSGATNLVRSGALGPQSWLPSGAEPGWQLAASDGLLARSDVGGPALLPPAFNRAAYTPAVLHVRFSEAKGGTVRPDTDAFLDLTLVPLAGEVEGRRVEVSKKEFATMLKQLYTQLSRQEPLNTTDPASASRRLHALLVAPIKSALQQRGITTLLISADRGLQGVPFAALHDGRRYFGDAYAFSLTPSLALTSMDPPQKANGRLLAAGSAVFDGLAPLPLVPAELEQVGQADRKDKALNRAFTPSTLLEQAADPRYSRVHVATHAEFLPGGPAASRLYSGTVPIPLSDFVKLRRARQGAALDLISFSACRTALGDADSELGFAGLALQAGARSAVGTLWYVDDVATSAYFVQMYRYLEAGIPKAEALQLTRQAFGRGLVRLDGDRLVGPDGQTLLTGLTGTQQRRVAAGLENPYFWAGIELLGAAW